MAEVFLFEIGAILFSALLLALLARALKQPLIPAYILAGVLIGPEYFSIIKDPELIRTLAELGIAFLLFTTGLKLDIDKIKKLGKTITFVSIFQIFLTFILGYTISLKLGFARETAIYLGFLLSLSSTMIVIKLCDEHNQLFTLHGRIIIGILLMQDIAAVAVLSMISEQVFWNIEKMAYSFITAIGFISTSVILGKYVFPPIIKKLSKENELLFIFSLSVLFLFSVASYILNFSVAVGAFLAGIALASFPYNIEIASSVKSLRDFFSMIFFVSLGMELKLSAFSFYLEEILFLSLFVIFVKPAIIYLLLSFAKYERKTAFLSGLYLGQTSEFSLIIAGALAVFNLIPKEIFILAVAVTLLTMSVTPYLIQFSRNIFETSESFLKKIDALLKIKRKRIEEEMISKIRKLRNHVIICGAYIAGRMLIKTLLKKNIPFAVIDYDPETVERLYEENIPVLYGDIKHAEVLEYANIKKARYVISTIPSREDNLFLITYAKEVKKDIIVICVAENVDDALKYYYAGADYVVVPRIVGGEKIYETLEKFMKNEKLAEKLRKEHIAFLEMEKMKERKPELKEAYEIKEKLLEGS